jgi:adenosylcobinamide-GDP ribazoletransferase
MMGLLTALRFLTILPIPGGGRVPERTIGRSTAWYPLVGLLVGLLLAGGLLLAARLWSALPAGAAGLALWVLATRGFHLDGLADTFDGIGGGATRERKLAIMKDSRVGVFGLLAVGVCLIGKFAFLAELAAAGPQRAAPGLLAAPALGRWGMLLALYSFPSAATTGLGQAVKRHCRWPQMAAGTATALAAAGLLLGAWGLALAALLAAASLGLGLLFTRQLGGLTGDTLGAICEIGELTSLAACSALLRLQGVP